MLFRSLFRSDRGADGALITRAMATDMLTAQIAERGLGVIVEGQGRTRSFSHGGTNEGYQAMMLAYPETCQGAAVMTNSDNGRPLINEVLRAIADEYEWPDPRGSVEVASAELTPAHVARYVGTYQAVHRPDASFEIAADGKGGLRFGWLRRRAATQWEALEAYPEGLVAPDSGMVLRPIAGPTGSTATLNYSIGFSQAYEAVRVPRPSSP